jgi:diguanylate cyclase (GGDEF)-like protein
VLGNLVTVPAHAARIGGDEFAVLLPGSDEAGADKTMEDIRRLVDLNNQYYTGASLSLSIGAATGTPGEPLEDIVKRADARMYEEKHRHYGLTPLESRRAAARVEANLEA